MYICIYKNSRILTLPFFDHHRFERIYKTLLYNISLSIFKTYIETKFKKKNRIKHSQFCF